MRQGAATYICILALPMSITSGDKGVSKPNHKQQIPQHTTRILKNGQVPEISFSLTPSSNNFDNRFPMGKIECPAGKASRNKASKKWKKMIQYVAADAHDASSQWPTNKRELTNEEKVWASTLKKRIDSGKVSTQNNKQDPEDADSKSIQTNVTPSSNNTETSTQLHEQHKSITRRDNHSHQQQNGKLLPSICELLKHISQERG